MSNDHGMTRKVQLRIRPKDAGLSLLSLLTKRFSYHTEEEWKREIAVQHLLLNDLPCCVDTLLQEGDCLTYFPPLREEPPVDLRFHILYENDAFLVIDKSGNLPCHPAGRYFSHTLWAALRERGIEKPEFVNRLDRETSGIVLVSKSSVIANQLRSQFRNQLVEKEYTVFVEGAFPQTFTANGWLSRDFDSLVRKKRKFTAGKLQFPPADLGAEWAETSFTLRSIRGGISRLSVQLRTGRTHQIRATLSSLGFPVVGDKLYGIDDRLFLRFCEGTLTFKDRQDLRISRQALHASRLVFDDPVTGERMSFTAPLPDELAQLC